MARNRKYQSGALWFMPALKAFLLCLLLGGTAVGYVFQKNRIYELGRQITNRESHLERLKLENKLRAGQLADMQMPTRLAERVRDQKLGLVPPPPGQIIWLVEPPVREPANPTPQVLVVGK